VYVVGVGVGVGGKTVSVNAVEHSDLGVVAVIGILYTPISVEGSVAMIALDLKGTE